MYNGIVFESSRFQDENHWRQVIKDAEATMGANLHEDSPTLLPALMTSQLVIVK